VLISGKSTDSEITRKVRTRTSYRGTQIHAYQSLQGEGDLEAALGKQVQKYTEKHEQLEQETKAKASAKRKKVEEAAQVEKAKKRTADNVSFFP
jgi:hypothetical protein